MSLIVKNPNADTIPKLLENIKDMALQMPSGKEYENLVNRVNALETQAENFETRIAAIEAKFTAAVTDNSHFICNDNDTYDTGTSKTLTITEGLITAIEA